MDIRYESSVNNDSRSNAYPVWGVAKAIFKKQRNQKQKSRCFGNKQT